MTEAKELAILMADALAGLRIPRDDEPSWLVQCEFNKRYLYEVSPVAGPITVAKQHARRFPTKCEAEKKILEIKERSRFEWRPVRIQPRATHRVSNSEKGDAKR